MTSAPPDRRVDDGLLVVCALSWVAALIHLKAAFQHLDEYVPYAIAFAVLAAAQLWWGFAVYRSATRRLLWAGTAASLLVVAVWVASRTSGLPLGPTPWRPEPVGALDLLASADEALLAALVLGRLGLPARRGGGAWTGHVLAAAALGLILLSSLTLVGGHGHGH